MSEDPNKSGFDMEPVSEESNSARWGCSFLLGLAIAGAAFWYVACKLIYAWWRR